MVASFLTDDPRAMERLASLTCIVEWTQSMTDADRHQFFGALLHSNDEVRRRVVSLHGIIKDSHSVPAERLRALTAIDEILFPDKVPSESTATRNGPSLQEAFVGRLKELMAAKNISQQQLADRLDCSQPAISQLLQRRSRPQYRTIRKLAEALGVDPKQLWPDLEVADMLDAVAVFEQDDYSMEAAEAEALAGNATRNLPKIPVKTLPTRP
jgi:transcriptional regulator with XRE-family HTH domain